MPASTVATVRFSGCNRPAFVIICWKRCRSSALIDRVGAGTDDRHAFGLQRIHELQRRLAAELHDHAGRSFHLDDREHVFERHRLEVQAIRRVVVRRYRLRIAVDHDGLVTVFAHRERRVHATVVELDPLPDSVGTTAQHHDLAPVGRRRFAFFFVGRVEIRGCRRKLRGARVDAFENGLDAQRLAVRAQRRFRSTQQLAEPRIGKTLALQTEHLGLCRESAAAPSGRSRSRRDPRSARGTTDRST